MVDQDKLCPICGEGELRAEVGKNEVKHKDCVGMIDTHYSVCSFCESVQANGAQMRQNKRLMTAFKKQSEGLLTGGEVLEIRTKLGLKQSDAATIFGGGPVAFSKYENDEVMQSDSMDRLLRLAYEVPEALHYLRKLAGFPVECEWYGAAVEVKSHARPQPILKVFTNKVMDQQVEWRAAS